MIFAALLATGSLAGRLHVLAGLMMLASWVCRRLPTRLPRVWMLAAVLTVLTAGLPLAAGQRLARLNEYQGQAYERIHIAGAALRMAWDRPLTGFGPGTFMEAFERYSFPNIRGLARYGKLAPFAHNEFLQLLAVAGIPALLLLGWLLVRTGALWRRQWLAPEVVPEREAARAALWAVLAGAAAQALVDFNWHPPALLAWGVCVLGAVTARAEMVVRPPAAGAKLDWRGYFSGMRQPAAVLLLALALAVAIAAIRPGLSRYFFNLGEAQRFKGNFEAAAESFEQALRAQPGSAEAFDRLGHTQADFYAATGSDAWFRKSQASLNQARKFNRLDAYLHRHLSQLYSLKAAQLSDHERLAWLDRAIGEYRQAAGNAPHQAFLYFEMGNLQREAGYLAEAEVSWNRAVALEPVYAAAWSNLGAAQELRGDLEAAEKTYRQALELRRLAPSVQDKYEIDLLSLNWAVVYFNLGHLLERQGRWGDAREAYGEVLALEPDNAIARRRCSALDKIFP